MSAAKRVGSLVRIIFAGFGSGAVLLCLWPLCPGVGGKFGFSAMLSVLLVERLPLHKFWDGRMAIDSDKNTVKTVGKRESLSSIPRRLSTKALSDGCPEISDAGLDWLDWVPARCWQSGIYDPGGGGMLVSKFPEIFTNLK